MNDVKIKLDCEEWTSYANLKDKSGIVMCPECKDHSVNVSNCLNMLINREILKRTKIEEILEKNSGKDYLNEIESQFDEKVNQIDLQCEITIKQINEYREELIEFLKNKKSELISQQKEIDLLKLSKENFLNEIENEKKISKKFEIEENYEKLINEIELKQNELEQSVKRFSFVLKKKGNSRQNVEELIGKLEQPSASKNQSSAAQDMFPPALFNYPVNAQLIPYAAIPAQHIHRTQKKPLLIVDPNSKKPINLQQQQPTQTTKSDNKLDTTSTSTVTTSTSSDDFPTQIIRKIKHSCKQINKIDKEVMLNRVNNRYTIKKPSMEDEELLREVRTILKKLTPQNLNKSTRDLLNLPINTEERLEDSIQIIFEKSLDEQIFPQIYADLCRQMTRITVPLESDPTKFVTFRTILLTKCQREFDSDYIQNVNYESLIAEAEAQTDESKRAELKENADEKLMKAKRRSLGNIRFIGELFKLKMLTEGIMNDCIDRLLKQDTNEGNLECLCKLLTTIGKELDRPSNTLRLNSYFEKLEEIARKKEAISARIRFMIMDVIEMRKNYWVNDSLFNQ